MKRRTSKLTKKRGQWTQSQIDYLIEHYLDRHPIEIGAMLNKTELAVRGQMARLHLLRRDNATLESS